MRTPAPFLALAVAVTLAAAGCGDDDAGGGTGGEVRAVATTTIAGDLVANVGGDRVEVEVLVPAGADPHDHDPRPSDAAALAEADVVVKSGGDLDGWLDDLIDNAGGDASEVTLLDEVKTIEGGHEGVDPHWWQDPRNAVLATQAIREALTDADPDGGSAYERNAAAYERQVRAIDTEVENCMGQVPADKRKLVTTHDSLGYFARRYDVEVIGAVIPSLSTQAQPSARDVDALVQQIEDEGVEAIFPEAAVSQRLEQAISRESGAEVGGELWTDSLAADGSGGPATYLDALRANAAALAEGMSGGRVSCGG